MACSKHCACCNISTLCEQCAPLEEHIVFFLKNQAWERRIAQSQMLQAEAMAHSEQTKNAELAQMQSALRAMEASQKAQA